ncbi:hypothetical protein PPERSA_00868 [Pseudocohnilembus persalinus]|uniref:Uncharacterized protein n=1 Tax=Pseudocohnilembus persalinus TaxID=266149 RepID=A0A0V0QEJ1_PSEPJ|nr:hypothetical protein PPERSA_00868 [Pseudocohnilembus persalinus]|eukprot:KRX00641.1 hypothetical protein PPERSA_00868 [Pseudocohnilembus persalinus]
MSQLIQIKSGLTYPTYEKKLNIPKQTQKFYVVIEYTLLQEIQYEKEKYFLEFSEQTIPTYDQNIDYGQKDTDYTYKWREGIHSLSKRYSDKLDSDLDIYIGVHNIYGSQMSSFKLKVYLEYDNYVCPFNCSGNGDCDHGCQCYEGYTDTDCSYQTELLENIENKIFQLNAQQWFIGEIQIRPSILEYRFQRID